MADWPTIPAGAGYPLVNASTGEFLSTAVNGALSATIEAAIEAAVIPVDVRSQIEASVLGGVIPRRRMDTPPARALGKTSGVSGTPTVASGGSGYAVGDTITLAGGTTQLGATAILRVAAVSSGAVTSVTVVRRGTYTATPSNPVGQASTSGAGTGATFTVAWSTGNGASMSDHVQVDATDARIRFTGNGPANISSSGYWGNSAGNGTHCTWEWATDATQIDIRLVGLNSKCVLYVDGQQVDLAGASTDVSGTAYLYTLNFGGAARTRNFKLVAVNSGFGGIRVPSTATVSLPTTRPKPLVWWFGDSYVFSTGAENISTQAAMVAGDQLDVDVLPDGIGGAGWTNSTAGTPEARINAKLATLNRLAEVTDVVLDMGYNNGSSTTGVEAGFNAAVAAVQTVAPAARIHVFSPATPLGDTTGLDAIRDILAARSTALGLRFYDIADVVNADNKSKYTGGDNVHPSALGHKYLGAVKAALLRPNLLGVPG